MLRSSTGAPRKIISPGTHNGKPTLVCFLPQPYSVYPASPHPGGLDHRLLRTEGALHLTYSKVFLKDKPLFHKNQAKDGSGGALYCGSVDRITIKEAHFIGNTAVWGGAVATFSSGAQAITSSSSEFSTFDDTRQVNQYICTYCSTGEESYAAG